MLATLLIACSKSPNHLSQGSLPAPSVSSASARSNPAAPVASAKAVSSAFPVVPAASGVPVASGAATNESSGLPVFELSGRSECRDCTYNEQLTASRERAEELGAKRVKHLVVERGKVSVEVYRIARDGSEDRYLHVVTAGFEPWEYRGFDDSDVKMLPVAGAVDAGVFFELSLSQCPGGACGGGCGPFKQGADLLFMSRQGKVTLVPHGNAATRGTISDVDKDGTLELPYTSPTVSLGACDGNWCCTVNTGPSIERYVGWDGTRWLETLPRLRPLYVSQREAALKSATALRPMDRSDRALRCQLATLGTQLLWLGQLLGEDAALLREQWQKDVARFTPADCFPASEPDLPDWTPVLRSRDEVLAEISSISLPRLF